MRRNMLIEATNRIRRGGLGVLPMYVLSVEQISFDVVIGSVALLTQWSAAFGWI